MKKTWWKSPFAHYLALTVFYWLHLLGAICLATLLVKPEKVGQFERFGAWVSAALLFWHFWYWAISRSSRARAKLLTLEEREEEEPPPPPYKGTVDRIGTGGIRTRVVDTTMSDLPPVVRGHREPR